MLRKINEAFAKKTNLAFRRLYPRKSTRYILNYFGNKPLVAAEIGTFRGKNAQSIIKTLNINKIYLIDPYLNYQDYDGEGEYFKKVKEAEVEAHKRLIFAKDKIVWIKNFSEKAAEKVNEELDFIYIDGNHDYRYVKKDLEIYGKKVKKNGIIAGHDTPLKDVMKAVSEYVVKNKFILITEDRDFIIIKK